MLLMRGWPDFYKEKFPHADGNRSCSMKNLVQITTGIHVKGVRGETGAPHGPGRNRCPPRAGEKQVPPMSRGEKAVPRGPERNRSPPWVGEKRVPPAGLT